MGKVASCCWILVLMTLTTLIESHERRDSGCNISSDDRLLKSGNGKKNRKFAPRFRKKTKERLEMYANPENDNIARECKFTGYPKPTVTWYKDGRQLESNERMSVRSTLSIQGLIYTDEGMYRCVIQNECGHIEWIFKQEVIVNELVGKIPPVILQEEENKTISIHEGEDATFQCVFYSKVPPTIWWIYYETYAEAVAQTNYTTLKINSERPEKYIVRNAHLNDSGIYDCVLKNQYGISGQRQILNVSVAPETFDAVDTLGTAVLESHRRSKTFVSVIIALVVILIIIVAGSISIVCFCQRRKRSHMKIQREAVLNPIYPFIPTAQMNIPDDPLWEFPRGSLELGEVIGVGFFGQVTKGYAIGLFGKMEPAIVAVKMLKPDATERELKILVQEMTTMKAIGDHINIINFLGCCTQNGPLFMLVEYARHGNLRDFLRQQKPPEWHNWNDGYEIPQDYKTERAITPLTRKHLISFAYQVAKGMNYLSSMNIIHRDLAARNILVAEDYVLKIGDFGLTKELRNNDYYTKQTETPLPIKWMAIECLRDRKFTPKSDVWSYGVLLWEIFTFGGNPYPSMNILSHESFYEWLEKGNRMDRPKYATDEIYTLMLKCWKALAVDRPTFTTLVAQLDAMLSSALPPHKAYLNLAPARNVDYIQPHHDSTDEEEDEGKASIQEEEDLDDNVFSGIHHQTQPLVSKKDSHRSDSQYSSLASSQEQTSEEISEDSSLDGYSTLSSEDIKVHPKRQISCSSRQSLAGVTPYRNHIVTFSRSADDVDKMESPLMATYQCHSERDMYDSNGVSEESDSLNLTDNVHSRQSWAQSAESIILLTDDDNSEIEEKNVKSYTTYSDNMVECVDCFV